MAQAHDRVGARDAIADVLAGHFRSKETATNVARSLTGLPGREWERIVSLMAGNGRIPGEEAAETGETPGPRVRVMADVEPEVVRWLWGARIPRGKLSEIVGDPGEGKSWLVLSLVGLLTTGRALPGDPDMDRSPETVLLVSGEDGAGDTIRPRLDAAGADVSRVHLLDGISDTAGVLHLLNLQEPHHRLYLARLVAELGATVVVVDPLSAHLGSTDSYRDSEVRGILAPLADMAETTGAAFVAVRHLTKGSASRAIYRAGGSIGFTGSARASMLVGRVEEGSEERACIVIKSNLAAFPDPVGFKLDGGVFRWTGTPKVTAADLLRGDGDPDDRGDRADAQEWLRSFLERGPQDSVNVLKAAEREIGASRSTVHRARRALGDLIIPERLNEAGSERGAGRWIWRLSDAATSRMSTAPSDRDTLERDTLEQPYSQNGFPPLGTSRVSHTESDTLKEFPDLFDGGA